MKGTDARAARLETEAETNELRAKMFEAARVDPEELNKAFVEMSALLAYWGTRTAYVHVAYLRAQARAKRLYGFYALQARKDLERERGKGARNVTEKMVEAMVDLNDDWQEIEEEEFAARLAYEEHKAQMVALAAKKDMLMQLGADRRKELDLDPTIRETRLAGREADRRKGRDEDG